MFNKSAGSQIACDCQESIKNSGFLCVFFSTYYLTFQIAKARYKEIHSPFQAVLKPSIGSKAVSYWSSPVRLRNFHLPFRSNLIYAQAAHTHLDSLPYFCSTYSRHKGNIKVDGRPNLPESLTRSSAHKRNKISPPCQFYLGV